MLIQCRETRPRCPRSQFGDLARAGSTFYARPGRRAHGKVDIDDERAVSFAYRPTPGELPSAERLHPPVPLATDAHVIRIRGVCFRRQASAPGPGVTRLSVTSVRCAPLTIVRVKACYWRQSLLSAHELCQPVFIGGTRYWRKSSDDKGNQNVL